MVTRRAVLAAAGTAGLAVAGCTPDGDGPAATPTPGEAPPPPPSPRPATTVALRAGAGAPSARGVSAFVVDTDGVWANPYDPAQVDLTVTFAGPNKAELTVPAFSFQDYEPATGARLGEPHWLVRVAFPVPGRWTATATLAGGAKPLVSAPLSLDVGPAAEADARGFVRVAGGGFRYDNGSVFHPVGANICWSRETDPVKVLADFDRWLGKLGGFGGNATRVWMAAWSFALEWKDTGLGDYTARLRQAWLLDQVLDRAHRQGIRVMLVLVNHGQFSRSYNTEWADNPYNRANGGPLAEPEQFVTDEAAQALFERRLRYVAGRWAAHPALWCWEWWNEVSLTPISDAALAPWITRMTRVLRRHDPYRRPITNSYASGATSTIWRLPELDFACTHLYSADDAGRRMAEFAASERANAAGKPVVLAEYGASGGADDPGTDPEAIGWHNGLWAAAFSGFASGAMYWWWDEYLEKVDGWRQVNGLVEFLKGERLADYTPTPATVSGDVVALALTSRRRVLAWVRAGEYTVAGARAAYTEAVKDALRRNAELAYSYQPPTVSGAALSLTGLADGVWRARWLTCDGGTEVARGEARVTGGKLTLAVPTLVRDIALKLER
ncbi:hypothetical protein GCM10009682_40410 [Luedemannella flava]|uniref:DUF5060 domain-containing protein n=1 Tax=Luedemannella flava TaxID=349316 RepID=A0ABP4YH36_9ACTN